MQCCRKPQPLLYFNYLKNSKHLFYFYFVVNFKRSVTGEQLTYLLENDGNICSFVFMQQVVPQCLNKMGWLMCAAQQ